MTLVNAILHESIKYAMHNIRHYYSKRWCWPAVLLFIRNFFRAGGVHALTGAEDILSSAKPFHFFLRCLVNKKCIHLRVQMWKNKSISNKQTFPGCTWPAKVVPGKILYIEESFVGSASSDESLLCGGVCDSVYLTKFCVEKKIYSYS